MILLVTIMIAALLAGFIQGVIGFGAGIVLMSVLPYFLLLPKAAALTKSSSTNQYSSSFPYNNNGLSLSKLY